MLKWEYSLTGFLKQYQYVFNGFLSRYSLYPHQKKARDIAATGAIEGNVEVVRIFC